MRYIFENGNSNEEQQKKQIIQNTLRG